MDVKVSVIIPSLNVGKYIEECLKSVVNQTLSDIEIICVDAGSTDGTLETIQKFAKKDSRIKLILSGRKSYGYQMNLALDVARGKYIGIAESDDFILPQMLERLYNVAEENNVDIVKSDYYRFSGDGKKRVSEYNVLASNPTNYYRILKPNVDKWIFYDSIANWTGLFRRDMIEKFCIRHNETPGAAYQDTGFFFLTMCSAKSIYFINEAFYMYRQDNETSSRNTNTNTFSVIDEANFIFDFLKKHPEIKKWAMSAFLKRMYLSFKWLYKILRDDLKSKSLYAFCMFMNKMSLDTDFSLADFSEPQLADIKSIMDNPTAVLSTKENEFYKKNLVIAEKKAEKLEVLLENATNFPKTKKTKNQKKSCLVSVIMPVYNVAPYLKEAIDSVINQTLSDIEIICIDDGSTDESGAMLDEYSKNDKRIFVIHKENEGPSVARNVGLEKCSGKYVYFMDSDDLLQQNALELCVNTMERDNLDVLYFDADAFADSEDALKTSNNTNLDTYHRKKEYGGIYQGDELFVLMGNASEYRVASCLMLCSRAHIEKYHLRFLPGVFYEDNLFSIQCMLNAKRVSHRQWPLYKRRYREGSTVTQRKDYRHFLSHVKIFCAMLSFSINKKENNDTQIAIRNALDCIRRTTNRLYNGLSKDDIALLNRVISPLELYVFEKMISDAKPMTAPAKIITPPASATTKPAPTKVAISHPREYYDLIEMKNSVSFRIGRVITFLPRKIRDVFSPSRRARH